MKFLRRRCNGAKALTGKLTPPYCALLNGKAVTLLLRFHKQYGLTYNPLAKTIQNKNGVRFISCINCGQKLPDGSNFCTNCGHRVSTPNAGTPPHDDSICANVRTEAAPNSDTVLLSLKFVAKYKGTPKAGYSDSSGTLVVYSNRFEYKKAMGDALIAGSGLIGLGLSALSASVSDDEIYKFEDILEMKEGKYMGVYNTLVLSMKDGNVWSFCPVAPKSNAPQKVIDLVQPYL